MSEVTFKNDVIPEQEKEIIMEAIKIRTEDLGIDANVTITEDKILVSNTGNESVFYEIEEVIIMTMGLLPISKDIEFTIGGIE